MFRMKEIEGELKAAVWRQEESIFRKQLCLKDPEMERFESLILYNLNEAQAVLTDNNDVRVYTDGLEKISGLGCADGAGEKIYSPSVLYYPQR